MTGNVAIFAEDEFAEIIGAYFEKSDEFRIKFNLASLMDCIQIFQDGEADFLIAQRSAAMLDLISVMKVLNKLNTTPVMLLFEKTSDSMISYSMTEPKLSAAAARFQMQFENALRGKYKYKYFITQPSLENSDAREEINIYENHRTMFFFLRDRQPVRASMFLHQNKRVNFQTAQTYLHKIDNYMRYDIVNPGLLPVIRELYFDVLKPSLSFSLYFYCSALIRSYIARESKYDIHNIIDNMDPELLRFSSIEKQYEELCGYITPLQSASSHEKKTKNTYLLGALDYIESHYRDNISVPDIANALFISQVYLEHIFHNAKGVSIKNYLINYRIDKAKELLLETNHYVYNIAELVGFRDEKHFIRTFKSIVGESPGQYRAKMKNTKTDT